MRGQASVEYIAAVALVALVLAGAGVAVAAPDLPGAVVRQLRLGLCIVGGNVCRAQDAADRGLEPCTLTAEDHLEHNGVDFFFIKAGGDDLWSVARRSDGQVTLTTAYGQDLGATSGVGTELGPVTLGGSVEGSLGFRSGQTWVTTEARLRYALAEVHGDPTHGNAVFIAHLLGEPAETFLEGGGTGAAELAAEAVRVEPAGTAEVRSVLGRRTGPTGTTYYLDLGADAGGLITGLIPQVEFSGAVSAEYRTGTPPAIALRTVRRDEAGDEIETVLRLPLRTAADAAAARRVAFLGLADPAAAVRDLVARINARGTIERSRYRLTTADSSWAYALGLGAKVGIEHSTSSLRRELVEAQVLGGPTPADREDCLTFATG